MGAIVAVVLFIAGIAAAAVSRLIADDFKEWTPWLVEWLIQRAAAQLPPEYHARLIEEWRGHINEVPGYIGKLWTALGLHPAARRISMFTPAPSALKRIEPRYEAEFISTNKYFNFLATIGRKEIRMKFESEPTDEEILAAIRRVIAEDEVT